MTRRALPASFALLLVSAVLTAQTTVTPVADAARRGDLDTVKSMLAAGADVNAAQGDGMTALHWAAERGDVALADALIYAGANVAAVTRIGDYTPLHLASRTGSIDVVRALLGAGADVDVRADPSGVTPLHLAATAGNVETIAALVERGADVNAREAAWNQTPLMFAAAVGRVAAIRALLERGADPNLRSTVLDLQEEQRTSRAATQLQRRILAAAVADGQAPTPSQQQGAIQAAREYYLTGTLPDVDPAADLADETAGAGRGGAANALNEDGPPPSIPFKGGLTALHHAARQGHVDAALLLVAGGADLNALSGDGHTPTLFAIINGQFDMAIQLVQRGADPNIVSDSHGVAPLWAAVNAQWQPRTRFPQPQEMERQESTYLDVMRALLDAGADPNARIAMHPWYMVYTGCGNGNCGLTNTAGSTAFWRAAYGTDVEAMRLLVEFGADPDIPTIAPAPRRRGGRGGGGAGGNEPDPSGLPAVGYGGPGVYPIHAAAGVEYGEGFAGNAHRHAPDAWLVSVTYLVEELGADVNARDSDGYNAVHHAAARGDNELIEYLVSKGADVKAVSRRGQTTADMANGPVQRVSPFPETVALLVKLGAKNNNNCVSCAP